MLLDRSMISFYGSSVITVSLTVTGDCYATNRTADLCGLISHHFWGKVWSVLVATGRCISIH